MLSALVAVFRKEVLDNSRDRRSFTTALVSPLLGPLAMVLMFGAMSQAKEKASSPKVPVVGQQNAPVLVDWLRAQGVTIEEGPADPATAIRRGDADVVVVIPETFGEELRRGEPAVIEVVADSSRQDAAATVSRVRGLLRAYGGEIGALRLLARGVDASVMRAVTIHDRDVGSSQSKTALLLGVLPMFLLMACFIGGSYVAIDATAGERERGSLEALLMNPVPASTLVLGKIAATTVYGVVALAISVGGFAVALHTIPFDELGLEVAFSLSMALQLIALLLPVAVLAAALQVAVGVVSRSFKTAQAAISMVMLLPTLPGAALTIFPQQPTAKLLAIPTVGHDILMMRLVRGEEILPWQVALSVASVLALAAIASAVAVRLFGPRLVVGQG